jgi:hypothetical protein
MLKLLIHVIVAVNLTVNSMGETEYFDIRRSLMIEAYIALGVLSRTELSIMRCAEYRDNTCIGKKQNIYEHNLDGL